MHGFSARSWQYSYFSSLNLNLNIKQSLSIEVMFRVRIKIWLPYNMNFSYSCLLLISDRVLVLKCSPWLFLNGHKGVDNLMDLAKNILALHLFTSVCNLGKWEHHGGALSGWTWCCDTASFSLAIIHPCRAIMWPNDSQKVEHCGLKASFGFVQA